MNVCERTIILPLKIYKATKLSDYYERPIDDEFIRLPEFFFNGTEPLIYAKLTRKRIFYSDDLVYFKKIKKIPILDHIQDEDEFEDVQKFVGKNIILEPFVYGINLDVLGRGIFSDPRISNLILDIISNIILFSKAEKMKIISVKNEIQEMFFPPSNNWIHIDLDKIFDELEKEEGS